MLRNDQLELWDRESFFHPSTHLAEFARGDAPQRVITGGSGVFIEDRDGTPTQLSAHLLPVYDSPDDIPSGDDPGTEIVLHRKCYENIYSQRAPTHWEQEP